MVFPFKPTRTGKQWAPQKIISDMRCAVFKRRARQRIPSTGFSWSKWLKRGVGSLNMRPLMEIRPIVRLPNWIEATKAASFGELFVLAARYL